MAGYQHKEGSFSLFKNIKKEKENHPDYRGNGMLNGKTMDIAAWVKQGSKGPFFSIKISESRQQQTQQPEVGGMQGDEIDPSSIPF